MKIALSSDMRTGLIDALLNELAWRGHEVRYFGPQARGDADADWPVVTRQAAEQVASGEVDEAIVLCWTGTGCSIAANKVPGIRAALCHDAETARGARVWNHANALALSLRATPEGTLPEILDAWFATPPGDDAWNLQQVARVGQIERDYQRTAEGGA
ncbi:RpiB/LacA/LacB family sugar-phosphate isomerase [Chloroflexia bacterium SDU3-3]|nr:RpiB/LacA/LacB family sugar-phosphate isomerase [Chloroflexia bacterium SDU3-3]